MVSASRAHAYALWDGSALTAQPLPVVREVRAPTMDIARTSSVSVNRHGKAQFAIKKGVRTIALGTDVALMEHVCVTTDSSDKIAQSTRARTSALITASALVGSVVATVGGLVSTAL